MGKGFLITERNIHSQVTMGGGSQRFPSVTMDIATGIGVTESTNGIILLRVNHGITFPVDTPTNMQDLETLIVPSQLRAVGVHVDEIPHSLDGNQCIIVNKDVIIPLTYIHGKMIFKIRIPTPNELQNLPMYDITPPDGWKASQEQIIEFDMMKFKDPFTDHDPDTF
jgi:hypothetical protein